MKSFLLRAWNQREKIAVFAIFSCLFAILNVFLIAPLNPLIYRNRFAEVCGFTEIDCSDTPQPSNSYLNVNDSAYSTASSSDLVMVMPTMSDSETLFNYTRDFSHREISLSAGECLATSNSGFTAGSTVPIQTIDNQVFVYHVVGLAPSFPGIDNYYSHASILLLAPNDTITGLLKSLSYVNFLSPGDVVIKQPRSHRSLLAMVQENQKTLWEHYLLFIGLSLLMYLLTLLFLSKLIRTEIRETYGDGTSRKKVYRHLALSTVLLTQSASYLTALVYVILSWKTVGVFSGFALLPSLAISLIVLVGTAVLEKRCLA
ncbi:MAG: hypothetical protein LKM30_04275 [Bacilli bacterium]|jgi:hypothetical protein|nr:hypothetical protein [Bacilli bacterium]